MHSGKRNFSLKPAAVLAALALIGGLLIASLNHNFAERISTNEAEYKARNLNLLLTAINYDNEPWNSSVQTGQGTVTAAYPATLNGQPAAIILELESRAGYVGPIQLLLCVTPAGTVCGARAINHRETPGLGDGIDHDKSDWIQQFNERSLTAPGETLWKTKKDGGYFDQLSGATVTSRAVTEVLRDALQFYRNNKDTLWPDAFEAAASQ